MAFEIKKIYDYVADSKKIEKIFLSPIFTSILITLVIMIIISLIFRNKLRKKKSFIALLFKSAIYILLATMGIIFLHNQTLTKDYEKSMHNEHMDQIVGSSNSVKGANEEIENNIVPINYGNHYNIQSPINNDDFQSSGYNVPELI